MLLGCAGSAVLIARTSNGGVMSLDGEHAPAMADARRQMSEACGGAYTIVGEHEVFAGVVRGSSFTERRVRFVCGAASTPAKGAP